MDHAEDNPSLMKTPMEENQNKEQRDLDHQLMGGGQGPRISVTVADMDAGGDGFGQGDAGVGNPHAQGGQDDDAMEDNDLEQVRTPCAKFGYGFCCMAMLTNFLSIIFWMGKTNDTPTF